MKTVTIEGENNDYLDIYFEDGGFKAITWNDGSHPDPDYTPCVEYTRKQLIKFHKELGKFIANNR